MTVSTSRRRMFVAALAIGSCSVVRAHAATWPTKPVRLIVPGTTGAALDTVARQLADRLQPAFGLPVVVENRAGAGGLIAMQHVARSAPDGHTLVLVSFTQLAVNPWMFDKPGYDPLADFLPVTVLFEGPVVLATRADNPLDSWARVASAANVKPGSVTYSSAGIGQPPHVLMEMAQYRSGARLLHVPYKGGPAAVAGVLAGDVDLVSEGAPGLVQLIKTGRLRGLAVTGSRRIRSLPDLPTFAELGVQEVDNSWMAVMAPAGTPGGITRYVQQEIAKIIEMPEVRSSWEAAGRIMIGSSPDAFEMMLRESIPKWRELVRATGLKPE